MSHLGSLLVASLILIFFAALIEYRMRRIPHSAKIQNPQNRLRLLYYGPLVAFACAVGLLQIPAVWTWYSAETTFDYFRLGVIVTIAITAWAGSLVAFTIAQRVTPRRTYGLRLLTFCLVLALFPMALNGAALRSLLLILATCSAIFAFIQLRLETYSVKYTATVTITPLNSKPEEQDDGSDLKEVYEAIVADRTQALEDSLLTFIFGGRYWIVITAALLICVALPSTDIVVGVGIALLFMGLHLVYKSIVEPFTPRFITDPLQTWKEKHLRIDITRSDPGNPEVSPK